MNDLKKYVEDIMSEA